jgi:PAS domain S-box-containing protein
MMHMAPPTIPNEQDRVEAVRELAILDTPPERDFDELAELAAQICETPIALLTLVDESRQWFKAHTGTPLTESPRAIAFCAHTIAQRGLFIVNDACADAHFAGNPLVTDHGVRFYAGTPLLTAEGHAVGTLCVIDHVPRVLRPEQQRALEILGRNAATQLELRRSLVTQRLRKEALRRSHDELEQRVAERTSELAAATKRAEAAQRAIAEIIDRISDGLIGLDSQWRVTYVNSRAAEIGGMRPEQILGKNLWTELPGGSDQPYYQEFKRAMEQQIPVDFESFYPPLQRWFTNRIYPSKDGISLFFRDITERKRLDEELRETEQRLKLAVVASGIGLWDWNIAANTVYFSPEWKAQLGYRDNEIENRFEEWERRLHPADRERSMTVVRNYLERPWREYENEFRLRHRSGNYRWMLARAQVFCDESGRASRMLGCHIDITERRMTEERLRASQAQLRALAAHLQAVREEESTRIARELHDQLGAALTGLSFEVNWIERQLKIPPSGGKLTAIRQRVRDILGLVDSTVGTVRAICSELRPAMLDQLGLATTIDWQATEFQTRTGIRCHVSAPEQAPADAARATALFRILQEILTNVARHARASEVRIELKVADQYLILSVADNGRGFVPDAASRKNHFGLVGMNERAIAAGGSLKIESAPDTGTRVTVRVPASHGACA